MKVYIAGYSNWDGFEPRAAFVDEKSAQECCDSGFANCNDVVEVEFYDKNNHEWLNKEIFNEKLEGEGI